MRVRSIAILATATVLPFVAAFAGIAAAVNHSVRAEQEVRLAQERRAILLRLQLDEETSVRGYVDTQNRVFLEPYVKAEGRFNGAFVALRTIVEHVAPNVAPLVDDQIAVHVRWLDSVAHPLIAHPKGPATNALQIEGKRFIDRFRDDNDAVLRALDDAGQRSDWFGRSLVYAIIVAGMVLGGALLALMVAIGNRQRRLDEELSVRSALHERETQIADRLQNALMPYDVPSIPGLRLHAQYGIADEPERVGGDWYDSLPMPDGRILIIIGDVTGHGISAIELMSRLRRKIIAASLHQDDPGAILTEANREVLRTFKKEPILGTAICAIVNPATCEITYANAGHPPPVLVQSKGGVQLLPSQDLMLGIQDYVYRTHVARASGSAVLIFYTDGLVEFTRDPVAGEGKLLEVARELAESNVKNPALAVKQKILGDAVPHDDVAILTVTFEASARRAAEAA